MSTHARSQWINSLAHGQKTGQAVPDRRQPRNRLHRTLRFEPLETRTLLSAAVGAHPAAAAFAGSTDHVAAGNSPAAFSITSPELITTIADAAYPYALAADNAGNLFFAESVEDMVFELNHATGAITTVAGNGNQGYGGDGGQATNAELCSPCGVAVNNAGGLFIADLGNSRVREVNLSTGVITTVAGNGTAGNSGDGGQASAAELGQPSGVAVDSAGDLFIADAGYNRIREVNLATGVISTAAGDGSYHCSGDGGQATAAGLGQPFGVAVDNAGDLFVADTDNFVIREVNHSSKVITTVAGNGTAGASGDGGQATAAEFEAPLGMAVDGAGDLYIADQGDNRVREVSLSTGLITAFAGNGTAGASGDGGPATAAELSAPTGLAVDSSGGLFIADMMNNRIREAAPSFQLPTALAPSALSGIGTYGGTTTLAATLSSSDIPLAGETVVFTIDGSTVGSATTDSIGLAVLSGVSLVGIGAGSHPGSVGATFAGSTDYAAASSASSLTIAKASLTVTANDATKVYGSFDPAFSASYSGFAPGEGPGNLSGWLAFTTNEPKPVSTAPVGTYSILPSGYSSANYRICYVTGTLTVVPTPSFALNGPSAGTFAAGQTVIVQWTATNVDVGGPTKISLAYGAENAPFSAEHWIEIDGITAANGAGSYSWNTAGVTAGTYCLGGYMYDFSTDQAVFSSIGSPIVIQRGNSFAISTPSPLTYTAGQNATIHWTESIMAGHSGSINLAYAPNATAWSPNATWMYNVATAGNGSGTYAWNTTGVTAGTYYLSGYFWDATAGQPLYSELYTTPIVIT